ncbi:MAG: hypothetical protein V3V70_03960 [Candidatus Scalindua sp.]
MKADHVIDATKKHQFLFVQSVKSGSLVGGSLTLRGAPLVIYFTNRPSRIAGQMSLKEFVDKWNKEGPDSFRSDPPNATLSILNESGVSNVVLELMNPKSDGDSISYKVRIISGNVPESFGPASLFIDC